MDNVDANEESLLCAYCQSKFKNKAELSKHIDRIHSGLGLLEGNRTMVKMTRLARY